MLTNRWAAIHEFDPSKQTQLELAKHFFQLNPVSEKVLAEFRAAFFAKDPALLEDNEPEMRVLAGAELVDCWMSYTAPWQSLAALLVLCGSCRGLRSPAVAQVVELSIEKLAQLCSARFGGAPEAGTAKWAATLEEQLKKPLKDGEVPALAAPLTTIVNEMDRLRKHNDYLARKLAVQGEETNILWWVFGGFYRSAERKYSDLKIEAAPLAIADHLANLVAELPGPMAAQAFIDFGLERANHKIDEKIKIKDAVAAIDAADREKWVKDFDMEPSLVELCPITTAIKLSLAVGKPAEWAANFAERTQLKKDTALPAAELGYQLYLELILNRVWKQI
jgi:hypothetical protein